LCGGIRGCLKRPDRTGMLRVCLRQRHDYGVFALRLSAQVAELLAQMKGGTEHDELHASSGNDILRGGELVDDMWGGYGEDTLYGSGDDGFSDYLNCQEGTNDVAYAGAGDRVSWSCEKVIKSGKIQRF
jgi:hypothetical protein